jgi:hypothetical protein
LSSRISPKVRSSTSFLFCLLLVHLCSRCSLVSSTAEKALTTQPVPHAILSSFPPPHSTAPLPSSTDSLPRVVSGFPDDISTPGQVWEILRPVSLREIRFVERGEPSSLKCQSVSSQDQKGHERGKAGSLTQAELGVLSGWRMGIYGTSASNR